MQKGGFGHTVFLFYAKFSDLDGSFLRPRSARWILLLSWLSTEAKRESYAMRGHSRALRCTASALLLEEEKGKEEETLSEDNHVTSAADRRAVVSSALCMQCTLRSHTLGL